MGDFSFDDLIQSPHTSTLYPHSKDASSRSSEQLRSLEDELAALGVSFGDSGTKHLLGKGTFAEVYAAQSESGERLAVKFVFKDQLDSLGKKNLKREILIQQTLHHDNVLPLLYSGEDEHRVFQVFPRVDCDMMEYLEHHGGRLSEPDTRHMFFQMCKALQYCHEEMHVAHRDVKLENFLLVLPHHPLESQKNAISNPTSLGPRVLLADFGFASMIRTGAAFTRPCGSPAYAAPEVLMGKPYGGVRADLYSLGVTLYAMLCGCFPRPQHPLELAALMMPTMAPSSSPLSTSISSDDYILSNVPNSPSLRSSFGTISSSSPSSAASPSGSSFIASMPQFPPHVYLSSDVKDLLHKLLQPSPKHRISWAALASHQWLRDAEHLSPTAATSAEVLGTSLPNFVPFGRSMLASSY